MALNLTYQSKKHKLIKYKNSEPMKMHHLKKEANQNNA